MEARALDAEDGIAKRDSLARANGRMTEESAAPVQVDADSPFENRPGALRGESRLTIKTHLAQQLVFGRTASQREEGKRAIIGLVGFASMVKHIFTGSKLDDPYADKWLLDIEVALDAAAEELVEYRASVAEQLAQRPDVHHSVAQSVKPIEVPLHFSNQFSFRAAYLVNDFDTLICAIQTAKHVAVMTSIISSEMIRGSCKSVRRAFTSANGYRYTGVSRADIALGTAKASDVLKKWGELPADILDGTRRAEYGPALPEESFANQIADDSQSVNGGG